MRRERLPFAGMLEKLAPDESPAAFMVRQAGTRQGLTRLFGRMTHPEVETLVHDLDFWARREQVPPASFNTCVIMAGRGFGKTWSGARWIIQKAREAKSIGALVGPTAADVRDTMIRGSSGILALSPPWFLPVYEPSKRRVTWPNGVYAICYSADKPDRLRGPNCGWAWGDEPASWKHEMAALDQLPMVLRIGTSAHPPQLLLTGTPRPLRKLEDLLFADAEAKTLRPGVVLRTGSSLANRANLAPSAVATMRALMHTRWGQQEVLGRLLMDVPGAIFGSAKWGRVDADAHEYAQGLDRRIVSVDPAPTSETGSDETGIVVQGVRSSPLVGTDGTPLKRVSVLKDASLRGSPREWAAAAIREYLAFGCDALVAEVNSGGEMVETTIQTVASEMGVQVNVKPVRAREAKSKRAEPVSALAETGRIELVGTFPKLEAQLAKFSGINGRRDDRVDALLWGVHDLVFADSFFCL
ncbi:ATP/GTP-binding protein [Corallococcus sp. AB032C]|uniref:terminase large subunit domain-containing protein n=1 Tax=Corallococcus TaxID=83461 RepID=UPI000EE371FD|nr:MULTISPECIES: terminase family protein [Corallococcus]NPC47552.1 DNA-packaging protein [Corallococcus exiguus]RKH80819.1 ATP/GTP-binding protein [Corallococcus sp. AB032C]